MLLAELMRGFRAHVNLIPYNSIGEANYRRPTEQRIEAFAATPITFKDEVMGVIAGFLRHDMLAESLPYGEMFGTYLGAAVANARAFEEIQRLKDQLEQHNAYLQEEVSEARDIAVLRNSLPEDGCKFASRRHHLS
jgi:GAF domain-containing protein